MALDAIAELLEERVLSTRKELKQRFTFNWLAEKVIKRQDNDKDTIIIIIGDRGEGKSTWGLKLIRAYIKLRKEVEKAQGEKFVWSWRDNFPTSRTQARKMGELLFKSFIFHDEGGDQFYTAETLKRAQRELVKFMNKDRAKLNLKIIIWPDPHSLDPKVINMAHLLVICPYRYKRMCAWAFIYRKTGTVLSYDRFGIQRIRKKLESPTKTPVYAQTAGMQLMNVMHEGRKIQIPYPRNTFKFLRSIPSFAKSHRYGNVDERFYAAYEKNVKNKLLASKDDDRYVPIVVYDKMKTQYETLLYNLYSRADMSYAQLERLHISPVDGQHLRALPGIKKSINSIKAMV